MLGQRGQENNAYLLVHFPQTLSRAESVYQFHLDIQKNKVDGSIIFFN